MSGLHIFTEELSAKICFNSLLAKLAPQVGCKKVKVYSHEGRLGLMRALRTTLPAISRREGASILVTIDQDKSDCEELKEKLEEILREKCECAYKIRIVCKELEAWFLGDLDAIAKAYPRFDPSHYRTKAKMRDVDGIVQSHQMLLKIIPEYRGEKHFSKTEVSEKISAHLSLDSNTSTSFQNTILAIRSLIK